MSNGLFMTGSDPAQVQPMLRRLRFNLCVDLQSLVNGAFGQEVKSVDGIVIHPECRRSARRAGAGIPGRPKQSIPTRTAKSRGFQVLQIQGSHSSPADLPVIAQFKL